MYLNLDYVFYYCLNLVFLKSENLVICPVMVFVLTFLVMATKMNYAYFFMCCECLAESMSSSLS